MSQRRPAIGLGVGASCFAVTGGRAREAQVTERPAVCW